MSDFPLQNKTTSNTLVLRLLLLLQKKKPPLSVQLPSFSAELFSPVPFPAPLRAFSLRCGDQRGWLLNQSCCWFFWPPFLLTQHHTSILVSRTFCACMYRSADLRVIGALEITHTSTNELPFHQAQKVLPKSGCSVIVI